MNHHQIAVQPNKYIKKHSLLFFLFVLAFSRPQTLLSFPAQNKQSHATVTVATADSSVGSKFSANFIGDGFGDQEEINAAIKSLPKTGGTILLMEGAYDIRKVENSLGGIIIDRSNVLLKGQGTSTKLILAPKQNTNVIRIIGSNIGFITIQDLYIDANRQQNNEGKGDPNVSHARFEFCGIKAFYTFPGGPTGIRNHHITIKNCHVLNSQRLGIMLEGSHMKVINNTLGNAGSDVVEILTGPGEIRGNYCEITEQTHVAIGSDRADSIIMSNNIIHVKESGKLDIGFRSWSNSHQHVVSNNIIKVDKGGICKLAMDIRGFESTITGNNIRNHHKNKPIQLKIKAGNTIITGNYFENLVIDINDKTGTYHPIISRNNLMNHSQVSHIKGLFNDKKK
jgi:Right handed beta helix region